MNTVLLYFLLILLAVLLSMLILFIIAISTGHSFFNSLLCAVTYYRDCADEKYCSCKSINGIPQTVYTNNPNNDYDVIGGVSGLGWVL